MLNLLATSTAAAAFFLTAGTVTPTNQDAQQSTEEEHVLDEIVTEAPSQPQLEVGPQTGELVFRPILHLQPHSRGNRVQHLDFYFTPVEETSDGVATLYSEQARNRYRVSVSVPELNPIGTRFKSKAKKIDLGTHMIDLPGGTYVLSEVNFSFKENAGTSASELGAAQGNFFGSVLGTGGGGNSSVTRNSASGGSTRSYCLSEETYAIDIQNGTIKFLGGIAMNEIPSNRARYSQHYPVVGISTDLDLVSGRRARDRNRGNVLPGDVYLLAFEAASSLCGSEGSYQASVGRP